MTRESNHAERIGKALVSATRGEDLEALRVWAQTMLELRDSNVPARTKAKLAVSASIDKSVLTPILHVAWRELRRVGWEERGLPARMAMTAAAAALTLSGQGAGIAALGGAIGVPLFVVFGAGGALAGVIVEEIRRKK